MVCFVGASTRLAIVCIEERNVEDCCQQLIMYRVRSDFDSIDSAHWQN